MFRNSVQIKIYRLSRLQWHRLQWESARVTLLAIPKPLLREMSWLQWQKCSYSDTSVAHFSQFWRVNESFKWELRHLDPNCRCIRGGHGLRVLLRARKVCQGANLVIHNEIWHGKTSRSQWLHSELVYALTVTVAYSDTFPIAGGCHCNRLDLYSERLTSWDTQYIYYRIKTKLWVFKPQYRYSLIKWS